MPTKQNMHFHPSRTRTLHQLSIRPQTHPIVKSLQLPKAACLSNVRTTPRLLQEHLPHTPGIAMKDFTSPEKHLNVECPPDRPLMNPSTHRQVLPPLHTIPLRGVLCPKNASIFFLYGNNSWTCVWRVRTPTSKLHDVSVITPYSSQPAEVIPVLPPSLILVRLTLPNHPHRIR